VSQPTVDFPCPILAESVYYNAKIGHGEPTVGFTLPIFSKKKHFFLVCPFLPKVGTAKKTPKNFDETHFWQK